MVVARGQKPGKGNDGYYEEVSADKPHNKPVILENGSVDYSNVNPFVLVEENETVCIYHKAQQGTYGYQVDGKMLSPEKYHEKEMLSLRVLQQRRILPLKRCKRWK